MTQVYLNTTPARDNNAYHTDPECSTLTTTWPATMSKRHCDRVGLTACPDCHPEGIPRSGLARQLAQMNKDDLPRGEQA